MRYSLPALPRLASRPTTAGLIALVFVATLLLLLYRFRTGDFGYTIGETLMNYSVGFYRRALIGNLFLPFTGKTTLLTLLALAYAGCLITPLVLIRRALSGNHHQWVLLGLLVAFLSPFGTLFYLKSVGSLKKELFFYPLFYALHVARSTYPRLTPLWMAAVIGLGSLIHESFFFLFLPFLLAYAWLNEWVTWRGACLQAGVGVLTLGLLLLVPGNSATITDRFVQQYVALGFPKASFYYFEFYQKLTAAQNLTLSVQHFRGTAPLLYFSLFVAQFWVARWLLTYFVGRPVFRQPRLLLLALGSILGGVFCLCFIGMDYGRWLAMGFTVSVLLIASQLKAIRPVAPPRPVTHYVLLSLFLLGWGLLLRIPAYTVSTSIDRYDWFSVTNIFN